jgi:hypothetical protein
MQKRFQPLARICRCDTPLRLLGERRKQRVEPKSVNKPSCQRPPETCLVTTVFETVNYLSAEGVSGAAQFASVRHSNDVFGVGVMNK